MGNTMKVENKEVQVENKTEAMKFENKEVQATTPPANTQEPPKEPVQKVSLKDKVRESLDKPRSLNWSWGKVIKTVAIVAAIPIAFALGKNKQKAVDDEMLDLALGDDSTDIPALPLKEEPEEVSVPEEVVDVDYEEVE